MTQHEKRLLALTAAGLSVEQLARALDISPRTVNIGGIAYGKNSVSAAMPS